MNSTVQPLFKTNIIHLQQCVGFGAMALRSRIYSIYKKKTAIYIIQRIVYVVCCITYTNGFT